MLKQECHSVSHVSRTQYKHIHHIKPTDLYFQTLGVSKCSLRLPSLKFTIKDCYMGLNKYDRSYASELWYRLKFQREYVAQLYHAMLSSLAFECFMFTPCVKCALRKVQTESIRVLEIWRSQWETVLLSDTWDTEWHSPLNRSLFIIRLANSSLIVRGVR